MPREKSTWRPPRGERTHAEHRDGPTRTSDEGRSCGRSKGVGPSGCRQRPTGNRRRPWRQRSRSTSHADADRLLGGGGVSREAPAPFCERPEVKLLRPTRPMFSDFKTRGFHLEASQIERTDRLSWFLRWRSTGRSRPECETPPKTDPPPKKSRGGATQEHRSQLDVAV